MTHLFRERIQPAYKGVRIHLLSTMDIPVYTNIWLISMVNVGILFGDVDFEKKTPLKFNIDTQNDAIIEAGDTSSKAHQHF